MLALFTDGVSPVKKIKNINNIIVHIFVIFLGNFSFESIILIPNITYDTCIPDTANKCDKLLSIKLSFISFSRLSSFPSNIPNNKFLLFSSYIFSVITFFIWFDTLLAISLILVIFPPSIILTWLALTLP